jgi:outer membrane protein OmpA-like peptidoglycan-associated protein/tetratricopeptide (TPR) repeat protein
MKTRLIIILIHTLLVHLTSIYTQNNVKYADNLFKLYEYKEAASIYAKCIKSKNLNNIDILRKLGTCYLKMGKYEKALPVYEDLIVKNNSTDINDIYLYAATLLQNEKIEDAIKYFDKHWELTGDLRSYKYVRDLQEIDNFQINSKLYRIELCNISTTGRDFSPSFYKNGLIFMSNGMQSYKNNLFKWDETPFLDVFFAPFISGDTLPGKPKEFNLGNTNSKYHDGPLVFSSDYSQMYVTRNNYYKGKVGKSKENAINLKIYYCRETEKNKWTQWQDFAYNSDEYSVGHPTLSKNNQFMYFISDMPGGKGGTDIYFTTFENGVWNTPINMSDLNTEGNEMFPFLLNDSTLYFSSDGLGGMGGLDIFSAKLKNFKLNSLSNLGSPINSFNDDFGYIYNPSLHKGWFSSNRKGGVGDDDIYFFNYEEQIIFDGLIVDNHTGKPLKNAHVRIVGNNEDFTLITDELGHFVKQASLNKEFEFTGKSPRYYDSTITVNTKNAIPNSKIPVLIKLTPNLEYHLQLTVKDIDSQRIIPNVKYRFTEKIDSLTPIYNGQTDKNGKFDTLLSQKNYGDSLHYSIKLEKEGYITKHVEFKYQLSNDSIIFINKFIDVYLEPKKINMDLGKLLALNPIYYDYDKWDIRPDAGVELDKIVQAMIDNPDLVIELGSHTDSRGNDKYNQKLSQKRAESAVNYIIEKGIPKNRIFAKGYGESILINHCTNGVECNDEEHQLNRRTEFRIVKIINN